MTDKIGEFMLRRPSDQNIVNEIQKKTTCDLKVVDMADGQKVEIYGDSSCRASLKEMKLLKGN